MRLKKLIYKKNKIQYTQFRYNRKNALTLDIDFFLCSNT
ncbi:hypothetical protein PLUTE_a1201 [Pseudoalteromonas luteoviolacea DSM 6061]|nr:hypothetical protein [Pseudoalteromonas luteoviolacea DSM 6061]